MARKSALLWLVALWFALPGCGHLSPFAGADVPSKTREPNRRDERGYSTAVVVEEQPQRVLTKTPAGPPPDVELDPLEPAATPKDKKPFAGVSGVVTEEGPPAKNALFELPKPAVFDENKDAVEPLALVLHHMLVGEHNKAIQILKTYDDATQEFVLRVMPPLTLFAKKSIDKMSAQEWSVLKDHIEGLRELLRDRCELLVTKMVYCKRVNGFADFESLPENHAFLAKTSSRPGDLVQLYIELKNFASKQTKEGDYLTKLACSLELKDMHGEKVWSHTFDKNETTHRRSACVNDYHGNFSFYAPALPAGTYQLTIQVVDQTIPDHQRVARKSQVFRVTPVANSTSSR